MFHKSGRYKCILPSIINDHNISSQLAEIKGFLYICIYSTFTSNFKSRYSSSTIDSIPAILKKGQYAKMMTGWNRTMARSGLNLWDRGKLTPAKYWKIKGNFAILSIIINPIWILAIYFYSSQNFELINNQILENQRQIFHSCHYHKSNMNFSDIFLLISKS